MTGLLPALILVAAPLGAQWLNVPAKSIPRLPNGSPNLAAPAPKTADGKPDLSGLWNPTPKYLRDIATGMKEEVPYQPWAAKLFDERKDGALSHEEPDANCLPQGTPKIDTAPAPYKIIQNPGLTVILYEAFTQWRQIFTDGRELPKDPNPTWFGYSVGKWQGDTLVVESNGFNGRSWLDQLGRPTSEAMRVTERFRRKDYGHLEIGITIDDPKTYTKPWSVTYDATLQPDNELMEFICLENEQDIKHMVKK